MDDKESAWRELDKDVDLYKFYLDLLLKGAAFVLGITGALTSYYFSHEKEALTVYSLLLPVVVNGGFCLICIFSIQFALTLRRAHYEVCARAGVEAPYEMSALPGLLILCSAVFAIVAVGLAVLFAVQVSTR